MKTFYKGKILDLEAHRTIGEFQNFDFQTAIVSIDDVLHKMRWTDFSEWMYTKGYMYYYIREADGSIKTHYEGESIGYGKKGKRTR